MQMPQFVLEKAIKILNKKGKAISTANILLLGAAYKKDISDIRESPIHNIITLLEEWNVTFDYHDPYVPKFHNELNHNIYTSVDLNKIPSYDLVIIITDHKCFDYKEIVAKAKHILDTRNACKDIVSENITRL